MADTSSGFPTRVRASLVALGVACALTAHAMAAPAENVILLSQLVGRSGYSGLARYETKDGRAFVLAGTHSGTAIVEVTDPLNPRETGFVPGWRARTRDIATYLHYAYVVGDRWGGTQIIDLSNPDRPVLAGTCRLLHQNARTIDIDPARGRAYLAGANGVGSYLILDLEDPLVPTELTVGPRAFHPASVHHENLLITLKNPHPLYERPRLQVLDVADPENIVELASVPDPRWWTFLAANKGASLLIALGWQYSVPYVVDLSDPSMPILRGAYTPVGAGDARATDVVISGDVAFIAYQTAGLKIVDLSDPDLPAEIGSFDTYPTGDGDDRVGCRGVAAGFDRQPDVVVAADSEFGLFVLRYRGTLGVLSGIVTDDESGWPVEGALVRDSVSGSTARTDAAGRYRLEVPAGDTRAAVSAFGYESDVVSGKIVVGMTTPSDATLDRLPEGTFRGVVVSDADGAIVTNAFVSLPETPVGTATNPEGRFSVSVPLGTYAGRISAPGFRTRDVSIVLRDEGDVIDGEFRLQPQPYGTDFERYEPSWIVSGDATTGSWELADPEGTSVGDLLIQPENDHSPYGTRCWVTGAAAGASAGSNDVDDGSTVLTTPTFALSGASDPYVSYWRWFSTGMAAVPDRDVWWVQASTDGGATWPIVLERRETPEAAWTLVERRLADYFTPTDQTQFRFMIGDLDERSLTEAALDDFLISDRPAPLATEASTGRLLAPLHLGRARPNPFRMGESVTFDLALPITGRVRASLFDVTGRRVRTLMEGDVPPGAHQLHWDGRDSLGKAVASGVYFLRFDGGGESLSRKVLLLR